MPPQQLQEPARREQPWEESAKKALGPEPPLVPEVVPVSRAHRLAVGGAKPADPAPQTGEVVVIQEVREPEAAETGATAVQPAHSGWPSYPGTAGLAAEGWLNWKQLQPHPGYPPKPLSGTGQHRSS